MTTKQQIMDLIAQRPNIRTVEISDILDMEVGRIRPLIEAELDSGEILVEPIKAPNGLMVHSFRFPDALPAAEPAPQAQPVAQGAAPRNDQVKARLSKGDLAIAYLREHSTPVDRVSTAALSLVMGLKTTAHPSSYLLRATREGRVIYSPQGWYLGPAAAADAPASDAAAAPVVDKIAKSVKDTKAAATIVAVPSPKVAAASPSEDVSAVARLVPDAPAVLAPTEGMPVLADAKPDSRIAPLAPKWEGTEADDAAADAAVAAVDAAAAPVEANRRFLAGLMTDSSLHIMIGDSTMVLPDNHARELWLYLGKVAPVQWPTS